jgi:hypothetical protein
VFTRALHWSLSWASSIQCLPSHPVSLRSTLLLFTTYVLVFLVVSFLLAFPPVSYMHSSSSPLVLHALPISSSFTWSFYLCLARSVSVYYLRIKENQADSSGRAKVHNAGTLGSWVRIPLRTWMCVCLCRFLCLFCPVASEGWYALHGVLPNIYMSHSFGS